MKNLSILIVGTSLLTLFACSSKETPTTSAPAKQGAVAQTNSAKPQTAAKEKQESISYATHPDRFSGTRPAPYQLTITDPKTANEHFLVAIYRHDRKQLKVAIEEYNKALQLQPVWALAHFRLGRAYQESGDLNAAIEQWKLATRDDLHYYDAYAMLADGYREKGDLQSAADSYARLLEFPPSRMAVHYRLAFWYKELGDKEKTRQHLESYIDLALKASKEAGTDRYQTAVHTLQALNGSR